MGQLAAHDGFFVFMRELSGFMSACLALTLRKYGPVY